MVLHQHVLSGNSDVGHQKIPVVLAVKSKFGSLISYFDSWVGLMVFISYRDDKGMKSIILVFNVQLGKNCSMGAKNSEISNPPLGCLGLWTMHDELLSSLVISGCGHETLNVRPVAKFCLGVTAQDVKSFSRF